MYIQALTTRVAELEKTVFNLQSIYSGRHQRSDFKAEIAEDFHCLTQFWNRRKEYFYFCVR